MYGSGVGFGCGQEDIKAAPLLPGFDAPGTDQHNHHHHQNLAKPYVVRETFFLTEERWWGDYISFFHSVGNLRPSTLPF